MKPLSRRSVTISLASLIEDHRAAYHAFIRAIDRQEAEPTPSSSARRQYNATNRAEQDAKMAVCAYPCRTLEEAQVKADYLMTAPGLATGAGLQDEHVIAILQSLRAA